MTKYKVGQKVISPLLPGLVGTVVHVHDDQTTGSIIEFIAQGLAIAGSDKHLETHFKLTLDPNSVSWEDMWGSNE